MDKARKSASRSCTVLGLAVFLVGAAGQTAARAVYGSRHDRRDRNERIETERRVLREDEGRLHHLERRLDDQTSNHEWRAARDTRREMDRTRADIDRDHRNLERDRN